MLKFFSSYGTAVALSSLLGLGLACSAGDDGPRGGDAAGGGTDGVGGATNTGGDATGGSSGGSTGADGGSTSSGGATGTGGGSTLPEDAILFQEDFEATADDSVPANWDSFVGYVVNMNNTKALGTYALVDSTKGRDSSKSLHVVAGDQPAMITRPLPANTERLYVRAYVWLTNQLGENPGHNHETLMGVRGTPGDAGNEVRFGEIKGVVGVNEVPSDDISPTMDRWGAGPVIPAGQWNCIEVAFLGDTDNDEVIAWHDGVEVLSVDNPSQWQNDTLGTDFLTGKFSEVILGWHSFSSYANEIWFDDVVVATQRIGCN